MQYIYRGRNDNGVYLHVDQSITVQHSVDLHQGYRMSFVVNRQGHRCFPDFNYQGQVQPLICSGNPAR